MKKRQRIISLGILAKNLNITKSRLEYYNTLGLIKPLYKMTDGVRGYDEDRTVRKITLIRKFQKEGMALQDIKENIKKK